MNRLLISTGLALSFSLLPAAAADVTLVQDEAYPPFMTKEDNEAAGILADIIKEAGMRMTPSAAFALDTVPWSRAVKLVEGDRAHGLVGTYYKPESRPWIGTYSEPLLTEQVGIYCAPGKAQPDWTYPDDYKGLTFGNNSGFQSPGPAFFELVEAGDIKLEEAQTTEQNLRKVSSGRVDCYVQERLTTEIALNEHGIGNVEFIATASEEKSFIGYRKTWTGPEAEAFIKAMDAAIVSMREDGTIDQIVSGHTGS
ncbi:transporter substrate-binding domain-containing protein [Roseibium denhamense]|uniref:Amino acid ABC transporter substrate-binding protein, PAAT family n=1 Tax=Roseibium denhamense TaxID=76305 RepID=A0ABY1PMF3_9HYPH|nr:transporter substrate-binding domain-containing protein [Roseibium denhamense]MTI03964.1 transporter substrate-binding domain-containing protein [Roseibium denhamense]SMP37369.1 amino acid ABC transporter substrate-binding protein, PAAT family [Roseibium denhamense]